MGVVNRLNYRQSRILTPVAGGSTGSMGVTPPCSMQVVWKPASHIAEARGWLSDWFLWDVYLAHNTNRGEHDIT